MLEVKLIKTLEKTNIFKAKTDKWFEYLQDTWQTGHSMNSDIEGYILVIVDNNAKIEENDVHINSKYGDELRIASERDVLSQDGWKEMDYVISKVIASSNKFLTSKFIIFPSDIHIILWNVNHNINTLINSVPYANAVTNKAEIKYVKEDKTTRTKALAWWANLDSTVQNFYIIEHYPGREFHSITGREIEYMWNIEEKPKSTDTYCKICDVKTDYVFQINAKDVCICKSCTGTILTQAIGSVVKKL